MRQAPPKSLAIVVVVAFSLFVDYFLYGVVMPLMAHSPAKITSEEQLGLLYGGYAVSVLLMTPLFAFLSDRKGVRTTMICGALLGRVRRCFLPSPAASFSRLPRGSAKALLRRPSGRRGLR